MLGAHALNFPCSAKGYKKVAMACNMQMTIVEWNTKLNHHRTYTNSDSACIPVLYFINTKVPAFQRTDQSEWVTKTLHANSEQYRCDDGSMSTQHNAYKVGVD